jgi:site-specific DNA recombinase
MSLSHANKRGVRYRYYVSQALLQYRKTEAGSISRASAPDVEALIIAAVRHQFVGPGLIPRDLQRVGSSGN